jgi:hypothetical protein
VIVRSEINDPYLIEAWEHRLIWRTRYFPATQRYKKVSQESRKRKFEIMGENFIAILGLLRFIGFN